MHTQKLNYLVLGITVAIAWPLHGVSAETRGPRVRVSCPIDNHPVSFRPVKSRLIRPIDASGMDVESPELHECERCGYVAEASEWLTSPVIDEWTRMVLFAWLHGGGHRLERVERWAGIGDLLSLPPKQRGIRYLMAATEVSDAPARVLRKAELAFGEGRDAWSMYFAAELRRQRGDDSAYVTFRELATRYAAEELIGRWARERLDAKAP